jgi:hypothetical protein
MSPPKSSSSHSTMPMPGMTVDYPSDPVERKNRGFLGFDSSALPPRDRQASCIRSFTHLLPHSDSDPDLLWLSTAYAQARCITSLCEAICGFTRGFHATRCIGFCPPLTCVLTFPPVFHPPI